MSTSVKIAIDKSITSDKRREIAHEIIEYIRDRTARGHGRFDRPWGGRAKEYSDSYRKSADFKSKSDKSGTVNLELSSDMLDSIDLLSSKRGELIIGIPTGTKAQRKAEGNILGTYGGRPSGKRRQFLSLGVSEVKNIIKGLYDGKSNN